MALEASTDRAQETAPSMLAGVGCRLIRYYFSGAGWAEADSLPMPFNIQYACFHPRLPIAYIACSNGGVATPGDRHCLVQVQWEGAQMAILGNPVPLPYRPLHAMVHPRQEYLALAYNRPAAVTFHHLNQHGLAAEARCLAQGDDLVGYFPHQIIPLPGCDDLLLTCRGDDATASSAENPGSLRILRYDGRTVRGVQTIAPNGGYGFGPRNCAFHPKGHALYAVLERQNRLAAFRIHRGTIDAEPAWSLDLLQQSGAKHRPQLGGAIAVDGSGQYAYIVNRAHPLPPARGLAAPCGENSLVAYRLDDVTGEPREAQRVALCGLHARGMALSQDGQLLVAAFRQPGRVLLDDATVREYAAGFASFQIEASGELKLGRQQTLEVGDAQLFWADILPFRAGQAASLGESADDAHGAAKTDTRARLPAGSRHRFS